jgi:hypothetical protein
MERLDDGELWGRVRLGDAEAFGLLFDRHVNAVHRFCFRRSADWALASERRCRRVEPSSADRELPFDAAPPAELRFDGTVWSDGRPASSVW